MLMLRKSTGDCCRLGMKLCSPFLREMIESRGHVGASLAALHASMFPSDGAAFDGLCRVSLCEHRASDSVP
jgi:hypothetical protein